MTGSPTPGAKVNFLLGIGVDAGDAPAAAEALLASDLVRDAFTIVAPHVAGEIDVSLVYNPVLDPGHAAFSKEGA